MAIARKKVVLIDDHHLVRAGLRSLVEDIEGYEVAAEGADGDDAERLLREHSPDILLMDIAMKRVSGLTALEKVKPLFPNVSIILLSMHATRDYLKEAFDKGAQAYLLKDSAEVELDMAFKAIEQGERYVSPKLSEKLLDSLVMVGDEKVTHATSNIALTKRQTEILTMIALGKGTKEIAYDLNLSAKTIESHRAQIMERLEIRDIASLVRYAIKKGLVSLDD